MALTCVNCRALVGGETGEIPMCVPDARGGDSEVWCPQCFTWKRAPLEPHRFHWDSIAAVRCGRCGVIAVDFGRGDCPQCSARMVTALPPKPLAPPSNDEAARPERSRAARVKDSE